MRPYKLQVVQAITRDNRVARETFATTILDKVEQDDGFLERILFSDEATFHVSGKVNKHNVRIWGSENPHATTEHVRDSPKVNVWCGVLEDRIIGPFFFHEPTVTASTYLDMLEQFVYPQLEGLQPEIIFQQDGAPPHWALIVRASLDAEFPNRWIGRDGPIPWPPRSPDVTPCDFFLWGCIKDRVYRTPVRDLDDLKARIVLAVAHIDRPMMQATWRELANRLDLLRVTHGAHVECL